MDSFVRQYKNQFPDDLTDRLIDVLEAAIRSGQASAGVSDLSTMNTGIKDSTDLDLELGKGIEGVNQALFDDCFSKLYGPISNYVNSFMISRDGEKNYVGMQEIVKRFVLLQPPKLKVYRAPDGGYHAWHQDWGRNPLQAKRLMVAMVYLNNVESGGETAFFHQQISVKPQKGHMVIFPPYFTHMHKGMPPVSNDKYICNFYIGLAED